MKVRPLIQIGVTEEGQIVVANSVTSIVEALGLCELAKDMLKEQARQPRSEIVPAVVLPGSNGGR